MKKKFLKIIVIFSFILNFSGCMTDEENETVLSDNSQSETIISETENIETENSDLSEQIVYTEQETVELICQELYQDSILDEKGIEELAEYMTENVESLSKRTYGKIVSEDDAVKKAREVIIETAGAEYIEAIESEYVELDGRKIKYNRNTPYYASEYSDKYDVWLIKPNLVSGIAADGRKVGAAGMVTYVMMKGSDGEVLAVFK